MFRIRDSTRRCLAAIKKTTKFGGDMAYAKAKVAKWGINIAKEAGFATVILEIDCDQVIELINDREGILTEIYWIISKIQASKKNFKAFEAKHVPKSCNESAYSLAKMGMENLKLLFR